jgi:hypothetical protein
MVRERRAGLKTPAARRSRARFDTCRAPGPGAAGGRTKSGGMQRVPIVDLQPLHAGTAAGIAQVAREIGAAARDIGFFAVTNHGVPEAAIDDLFAAAHAFFALPEAVKLETPIEASPHYLGYARMAFEKLDPNRPGDAKESFNMGRERLPDDPELRAGAQFAGSNQWPRLPGFRATLTAYFERLSVLGAAIHRAIAVDLGLDADYFASSFDRIRASSTVANMAPDRTPTTAASRCSRKMTTAASRCGGATANGSRSIRCRERSSATSAMR